MRRKQTLFTFFLYFFVGLSAVTFLAIIALAIIFRSEEDWRKVLFDLVCGLLSALIITGGLGFILDLIKKQYLTNIKDVGTLRSIGIYEVGSGKSHLRDTSKMFGTYYRTKNYPYSLKFMFLTGQDFIHEYQSRLIKCLNEGCRIQFLLAEPDPKGYLQNIVKLMREENGASIANDIIHISLPSLKEIWDQTDQNCKGTLAIRFYKNEYMNSLRIAKYGNTETMNEISYYWINVHSFKKCPKDNSVCLKGYIEEETATSEANLWKTYEAGFDELWKIYDATEILYTH